MPVPRTITPAPAPPPARAATQPATPATTERTRPAATTPSTSQRRPSTRRPEAVTRQLEESGNLTVHIVKRGESIISIARKYEVTVDQLKQWNGLQGDNVVPGMEMYVFVKPPR
jgi:LysM repeat protein